MFKIRYIAAFAAFSAAVTAITGCTGNASQAAADSSRISIVCTIFPEYDWVKTIMGDKAGDADITYLLGSGVDMHNYRPTADDIIRISNCDLFVYVGGESDEWAEDAIEGAVNKEMKVVNLLGSIGENAKPEELKEGMQDEEEEDGDAEEPEYDEHIWLSVKNTKLLCAEIAEALCAADPANADTYNANLSAYSAELDVLDGEFEKLFSAADTKTLIFGDRFPFRYFVDDYGLDYYAAFAGCSAETEASFETIVFLAQKADELDSKTIYTIENSDKSVAQTIISNTQSKDQTIAELNSLQSVSLEQADAGDTYISLMRKNLGVLQETLNQRNE